MNFRIHTPQSKAAVIAYIHKLPGKLYDISITLHREKRSSDQNSLYWMWLSCLSEETGHDKDDLHIYFRQKFIGLQVRQVRGETIYIDPSTTRLDRKQFSDYLNQIQSFSSRELGVILPTPEDLMWEQFKQQYR